MKFEAFTLEEAITKASNELGCSVVDLNIDVLQHPSRGILGLFKKNAIIEARKMGEKEILKKEISKNEPKKQHKKEEKKEPRQNTRSEHDNKATSKKEKKVAIKESKPAKKQDISINDAIYEVEKGLNNIFNSGCFDIDNIKVAKFDNETIAISLDGSDAALLIGKEGYRYKALSYMLHNWIYPKYGYYIRLEIAQFLKNQEEMISVYLKDVIEKAKNSGKAQTKPLDGVLVKIALEQLRDVFPDKYVGVRSSRYGKYVIINEYKNK